MNNTSMRENIDELIKYFWQNGYMTIKRKYGTYLPEPSPIGKYDVDAVGRLNKKFALGVIITEDDLKDNKIISKLEFLATRQTKYSNKKVVLFAGVQPEYFNKAKVMIETLSLAAAKNIKLVILNDKSSSTISVNRSDVYFKNFS
jgi:hypothetical protein